MSRKKPKGLSILSTDELVSMMCSLGRNEKQATLIWKVLKKREDLTENQMLEVLSNVPGLGNKIWRDRLSNRAKVQTLQFIVGMGPHSRRLPKKVVNQAQKKLLQIREAVRN